MKRLLLYGPQSNLDNTPKDDFNGILINVKTFWEKEIVVITGGFNEHVGCNPESYDNQHDGSRYGVRNNERERILEF